MITATDAREFLKAVRDGRTAFDSRPCTETIAYVSPHYCGSASERALCESNASEIYKRLAAIDPDNVSQDDDGSVTIAITASDTLGEDVFTAAFQECIAIASDLDQYPILSDDAYSDLQSDWCDEHVDDYLEEASELLTAGDAKAIEYASEVTVDAARLLANPDREAAIRELAYALADTAFMS